MQRLKQRASVYRYLRPLGFAAFCLYLALNVFLILCLIHPHSEHIQGQVNGHLASICVWVHKTVSPHTTPARVTLPMVEAILFVLLPLPWLVPQTRVIQLTGRSPPTIPSLA